MSVCVVVVLGFFYCFYVIFVQLFGMHLCAFKCAL